MRVIYDTQDKRNLPWPQVNGAWISTLDKSQMKDGRPASKLATVSVRYIDPDRPLALLLKSR